MHQFFIYILFLLLSMQVFSQEDANIVINDSIKERDYYEIAIKPTKASFYSAILPGLGQAYNKDYWKIPVVYGALGTSLYKYDLNNKRYHKYRDLYKELKMNPASDMPYSLSYLESAQKFYKKYRDLSMLVTAGLYLLQIVEASVDAHMKYHNTDPDLSFKPAIIENRFSSEKTVGVGLSFSF